MNKGLIIGGAVVVAAVAFIAGAFLGPQVMRATGIGGAALVAGPGGPAGAMAGGPMANLTEEERVQVQNMSDDERRQFFAEKMGGQAPAGGPGGGRGGMVVEGEVLTVATDSVTVKTAGGGSQTIYLDDSTAIAQAASGSGSDAVKAGDTVVIAATPEADNVVTASAVVVK